MQRLNNQLDQLRDANNRRQQLWDPNGQITVLYRATEFGGEAGEVQNVIKKLERERMGLVGSRATLEKLGEELADTVICADLIALHYNIPLWNAITRKFNITSRERGLDILMDEAA